MDVSMKTALTIPSRPLLLPVAVLSAVLAACSPSPASQAAASADTTPVAAPVTPTPVVAQASAPAPVASVAADAPASEPAAPRPHVKPAAAKVTKKHAAPVVAEPAPVSAAPAEKVAQQSPPPPPKPVCAVCGTVEAVTPVQVKGESKGGGAVAGVLLGGVLGHQVGGGRGKDLATVVGAVGGGMAGNEAEKRYKSTTRYQVQIRMDDGSTRTVMHDTQMMVGQKVTVENGQVSPAQ